MYASEQKTVVAGNLKQEPKMTETLIRSGSICGKRNKVNDLELFSKRH